MQNKKIVALLLGLLIVTSLVGGVFGFAGTPISAKETLREARALIYQFDFLIEIIVFLLAIGMLIVSGLAFKKAKSDRLLFVFIAFVFFFLRWGIKLVDLLFLKDSYFTDPVENLFEIAFIVFLFIALFRK